MFLNLKRRILTLMDTVADMLEVMPNLSQPKEAILDCLYAIETIFNKLLEEEVQPKKSMVIAQGIHHSLLSSSENPSLLNIDNLNQIKVQLSDLKSSFKNEVKEQFKVAFFPYKASMWDSLETIYEAAKNDENCIAHVIPIPYYQLSNSGGTFTYEGERFPSNIPITHFSEYNLELEQPDIIFIHNIYDNYNTLTQVHENYFTHNLKQNTSLLVYVPYFIPSFITPEEGAHSAVYSLPTVKNVDKIITINGHLKDAAIKAGVPEEKLLNLGSPKLDALFNTLKGDVSYPEEWKERIEGKTVYLINTGCLFFAEHTFVRLEKLVDFFNIPRIAENSVVIWRPHPLTYTSILKYTPSFKEYYINLTQKYIKGGDKFYSHIILDETDDYLPALVAADVLISPDGSLLRSFLLTEKKVLFWDDRLPEGSMVPTNAFYYAFNNSEPWYELVKKFSDGYDPLAENRRGVASHVYENTDGTAGAKIFKATKEIMYSQIGL